MGEPLPGMVGRSDALRPLLAARDRLATGAGQVAVLHGEPGIGRTTVCEAFAVSVQRPVRVSWATCLAGSRFGGFGPWRRLLSGLDLPAPVAAATSGPARETLFANVLDSVRVATSSGPVVLILDDAHLLDADSCDLLEFLVPEVRRMPLLLVLSTLADQGLGPRLMRLGGAIHVPVGPLQDADLRIVIAATGAVPATPDQVERVLRRASGNPLFARELALTPAAAATDPDALPATVRAALRLTLDAVPDPCRPLVDAAAISGDESPIQLLVEVLDQPQNDVLALVDAARQARVLVVNEGHLLRFRHPLVRDEVLAGLSLATRVALHRRTAAVLEGWRRAGRPVDLGTLADHCLRAAAAPGAAAPAVRAAVAAADQAMRRTAFQDAANLYERALSVLPLAPEAADRVELLLRSAEVAQALGRPDQVRRYAVEAARLAREAGSAAGMARAALAMGSGGFEVTLFDDEHQALLAEARAALADDVPWGADDVREAALAARVSARLSVATSLTESTSSRIATARSAVDLARRSRDPEALGECIAALCDALSGPAETEQRLALATEMLALARSRSDLQAELLARRLLLVAHLERGETDAVDMLIDAYALTAHRLRQPGYEWYVPLWRAMRAWMSGDDAAAARASERAEAIGAEAGSGNARLLTIGARVFAALDRSPTDEDVPFESMPTGEGAMGAWMTITRACCLAALGRIVEARTELTGVAAALPTLPLDSEYLPALVQAARAAVTCGDATVARQLYDALLPHRSRMAVEGIGAYCHGSVERHLGELALAVGERARAAEHLERARTANVRAGAAFLVGLVDAVDPARGGPARATGPTVRGTFRRDGDGWRVGLGDRTAHLADSKGVRDIAILLAQPALEVAALDLVAGPAERRGRGGGAAADGSELHPPGDLGDVVDAKARAAYRQRLTALEEDLAEAELAGDTGRAELARVERDQLVAHLASAYGLGGRTRRLGDPAERARSTVTARVRQAIARIAAVDPELGEHLRRAIRTGRFCRYDPERAISWDL